MISCISFTANGGRINRRLKDWFLSQGIDFEGVSLARYAEEVSMPALAGSYKDWVKDKWPLSDCLIFISASGIAVRGIAPYVKDKKTDPAVLVIDEQGKFVISLLSGHIGGANEMTGKIAAFLQSIPVITTGTDVNQTFAVDVFATRNDLQISDMTEAKAFAASIIDKKPVWFFSELPVTGNLPKALQACDSYEELLGAADFCRECKLLYVGYHEAEAHEDLLTLTPKCVHLGIGCKRDTPFEKIEALLSKTLEEENIPYEAIASVASIDLKKDEQGLIGYCEKHGLPFHVYSAEELGAVEGAFTPSKFVGSITGVDNVCERASAYDAILAKKDNMKKTALDSVAVDNKKTVSDLVEVTVTRTASNSETVDNPKTASDPEVITYMGSCSRLIRRKTALNGVTVAIAIEDRSVHFE